MFKEDELKLMEMNKRRRNNKNLAYVTSLEETLEIIKPGNNENNKKYVNGKMIASHIPSKRCFKKQVANYVQHSMQVYIPGFVENR